MDGQSTIWPAPMTPSFLTSAAAPTVGVELKLRHCLLATLPIARLEAAENILQIVCVYGEEYPEVLQDTHVKLGSMRTFVGKRAEESRAGTLSLSRGMTPAPYEYPAPALAR